MTTHFEIDDSYITEQNRKTRAWVEEDYEHLGKKLRRRNVNIDDLVKKSRSVSRRRSIVGRWHWRDALRSLSRTRRTTRHLREAGRLRNNLQVSSINSGRVATYSVGQT